LPAAGDEAGTLRMGTTGNSHLMLRVIGLAAL
jgi:hypothetical protein